MNEKASLQSGAEIHEDENPQATMPAADAVDTAVGVQSTEAVEKPFWKSLQFNAVFLSVSFAYTAATSYFIMLATVLPTINATFGPDPSIVWVFLISILGTTATYTLQGRLSDIFGRRYFFLGGAAFAFVGFIVSGTANSLGAIIGGNLLTGIGMAVLQSEPTLIGELVPNKYRYTVLGATSGLLSPIVVTSPGLAGVMSERLSWRWAFYFPAIFTGIAFILQFFFYFPPKFEQLHSRISRRKAALNFDYGGVVIFVGSLVSFLLGVSWGGQRYPWDSAEVISTLVVGAVGLVGFGLWEYFIDHEEPLVLLRLFKNYNYMCCSVISGVGFMIYYALNSIYPQQAVAVWGKSTTESGWYTCSIIGGVMLGQFSASFTATFLQRFVSVKWQLFLSNCIFAAFMGGLAHVTADGQARQVAFSAICGLMIGFLEVLAITGAVLSVPYEDLGAANGLQFTIRGTLSAISTSIYSTILSNKTKHYFGTDVASALLQAGLPEGSLPAALGDLATGNAAGFAKVPGVTPEVLLAASEAVPKALCSSYQVVYLASLAFGGVAIIASLLIKGDRLAEKMTPTIARKLQPSTVLPGSGNAAKDNADAEK